MGYRDTSCLLKLYVSEVDSAQFRAYIGAGPGVVTSDIARFEFWATLRRKEAAGELVAGAAQLALGSYDNDAVMGVIHSIPLDAAVIQKYEEVVERCFAITPVIPLRSLDAIHLAAALVSGNERLLPQTSGFATRRNSSAWRFIRCDPARARL